MLVTPGLKENENPIGHERVEDQYTLLVKRLLLEQE